MCLYVCACLQVCVLVKLIAGSSSIYIMCVLFCLFSILRHWIGTSEISIIIIKMYVNSLRMQQLKTKQKNCNSTKHIFWRPLQVLPPPQPEKSSQLLDHYWHLRGLQRGQTVYKNQRKKIRTEVCSTSPVPWTPPAVWQGPLSRRQGNGVSSSLHLSSLPVIVQSVLAEAGAKKHRCGYVFTHTDRSLLEQWQWNPHPKNNAKVTNFAIERLFSVEIFALLKTQFIYASSVTTSKIILLWKKKYQ